MTQTGFTMVQPGPSGRGQGLTQFGRALDALNIDIICANSPQAKGRVERMKKTLQDRLVKELRLAGVSNAEGGNAFAPGYMEDYNRRFARAPANSHDAHRPLQDGEDLSFIFTWQEDRTMSRRENRLPTGGRRLPPAVRARRKGAPQGGRPPSHRTPSRA
jgi:hypothetical protein